MTTETPQKPPLKLPRDLNTWHPTRIATVLRDHQHKRPPAVTEAEATLIKVALRLSVELEREKLKAQRPSASQLARLMQRR